MPKQIPFASNSESASSSIAAAVLSMSTTALASRTNQLPAGKGCGEAVEAVLDVLGIEKQQAALEQPQRKALDRPRIGVPVQFE